ncbi:DeoR/GlpR family DNA-binding transcription regulator [Alicyclobacillus fastidiosus]|uniref:DeoR/GlpR family DNA-binding transcription regulator n=1 Tax=Alicyclobacillus fastidiosus TaxID=392011 RepID=A0ABV5AJE1_9BACL|nr:DeoR/GlpR family DNA-binding transcription regulator [Alicyclobacillus fastidiosus]WEH09102.1 DeoR/GlpR family DNA-binding transcription regulator [Alicyclobacillus fastidiosus]
MDNNAPNTAVDRRDFIVEYLKEHGETRIDQLSELCEVSEITLRRDLEILESQNRIRRVRGGAAPALANPLEEMFHEKLSLNTREKREIARTAAALVQDSQVVILSAGTTTTYIARELTKKQNITIVTSAINIAAEVAPYSHITLVMIGGIVRSGSYAAVGHLADDALDNINADIAFVGVDGVDTESGFTTPNFMEARTDTMMLKSATTGYIVADDSKFGKVKIARVARLDEPSGLIVNRSASDDFINELEMRNCRVIR